MIDLGTGMWMAGLVIVAAALAAMVWGALAAAAAAGGVLVVEGLIVDLMGGDRWASPDRS